MITGGARRLGRATALALAEAGADVAITFLHSGREAQHAVIDLSSFGVRAVALRCDITDEKSVKATIREIGRELGGLDILVNNAANYETVGVRAVELEAVGRHFRFECTGAVSGVARGFETAARAPGENHQHGIAGWVAALG